jgi:hypothetical protein
VKGEGRVANFYSRDRFREATKMAVNSFASPSNRCNSKCGLVVNSAKHSSQNNDSSDSSSVVPSLWMKSQLLIWLVALRGNSPLSQLQSESTDV